MEAGSGGVIPRKFGKSYVFCRILLTINVNLDFIEEPLLRVCYGGMCNFHNVGSIQPANVGVQILTPYDTTILKCQWLLLLFLFL